MSLFSNNSTPIEKERDIERINKAAKKSKNQWLKKLFRRAFNRDKGAGAKAALEIQEIQAWAETREK